MGDTHLVTPNHPGVVDEVGGRKRKRQKIARVIRAVFIETSLARKIRNRKLRRQSSRWEIREPSEATNDGSVDLNPTSTEAETSDDLSSPTNSDTTTIYLLTENEVTSKENKKRKVSRNIVSYFLPVVLLVLILLGKVCAIFFTSTWLFSISALSGDPEGSLGEKGSHMKHYLRGPLSDL